MDDDWAIQILFKILDDSVEIILGGLNQVDGGDPMKLLSKIFDVEIKGDIAFPKIFHFEKGGVDLPVKIIKDKNFPKVLTLVIYFFE